MNKFDVAVYYRLDAEIAGLISKHAYSVYTEKGHRFQVALDATDPVLSFVKRNPDCLILDLTYQELTGSDMSYYKGKTRYVIIGVSLKKAKLRDFKLMTNSPFFYCSVISENVRNNKDNQTFNPNIFYINGNFYHHVEHDYEAIVKGRECKKESEWLEMWKDFDHYYSYSDDHSVWRRWNNKEKEIYQAGIALGLTQCRMENLYRVHFC